ncbi:hypothetical protein L345_06060, partial [Ophiophagus hannah]
MDMMGYVKGHEIREEFKREDILLIKITSAQDFPSKVYIIRHKSPNTPDEDGNKLNAMDKAFHYPPTVTLRRTFEKLANKMVITNGNEEEKGNQEKESKEESILALLGIIGTILNLIVISSLWGSSEVVASGLFSFKGTCMVQSQMRSREDKMDSAELLLTKDKTLNKTTTTPASHDQEKSTPISLLKPATRMNLEADTLGPVQDDHYEVDIILDTH